MATQHSYFTQDTHPRRPKLTPVFLTSLLAAGFTAHVQAVEFQLGEIQGRFESNISIGTSIRTQSPDRSLISVPNDGTSRGSGSFDDGAQNFKRGKPFSTVVKGVHDLELSYENVGFFGRGKYWYDYELKKGSRPHGHAPNQYVPNTRLNDKGFNDFAKFSGIELLDAYFYGGFDLGHMPLDIRVGRQVINWGESTFIQGGINAFNPIDVTAFRRPGAELEEGLLPFGSVFASLGLTDNLSVEGFYQYKWEPTVIDGCGTYFSTNDFTAQGCDGIRVAPLDPNNPLYKINDQTYFNPQTAEALQFNPVVQRNDNGRREAKNEDQFGIGFRYFSENLNNTEFGLYYAQYHSRLPFISGVNTPISRAGLADAVEARVAQAVDSYIEAGGDPANLPDFIESATEQARNQLGSAAPFGSTYFVSYPEKIRMVGLSFSTNLGDIAWSGEISHKRDMPIQVNGPLLVGAILTQFDPGNPASNAAADRLVAEAGPGGTIQGYETFNVTQAQTTFIKFFDNVMGASRLTSIAELGWTHVHGLDTSADALKFGRAGTFGYQQGDNSGFVTKNSYGYVLRGALEYPNAVAGMTLIPELNFRHGVRGNGPEPGAAFRQNEKSVNVGLTADYMNRYRFGASYTTFFGGSYNAEKDRDFISLSASIAF